jgi:hypothetical protein
VGGLPGELVQGVERVVHLDPADLAESGLARQLAEFDSGSPRVPSPSPSWASDVVMQYRRENPDFLLRELASATGIHGRPRRLAPESERARVNVTRAIRSAIGKVRTHDPAAAAHLDQAVRTGAYCSYQAQG